VFVEVLSVAQDSKSRGLEKIVGPLGGVLGFVVPPRLCDVLGLELRHHTFYEQSFTARFGIL
jgi:hypothetical protein